MQNGTEMSIMNSSISSTLCIQTFLYSPFFFPPPFLFYFHPHQFPSPSPPTHRTLHQLKFQPTSPQPLPTKPIKVLALPHRKLIPPTPILTLPKKTLKLNSLTSPSPLNLLPFMASKPIFFCTTRSPPLRTAQLQKLRDTSNLA